MVRYLYVSPVGTSLLQNLARRRRDLVEKYSSYRLGDWSRLPLDDPMNKVPDGYVCQVVRGHEVYEALLSMALEDPRGSSAELNGLLGIASLYNHSRSDAEVLLYKTRSCTSRLCSSVVAEALRRLGFAAVQEVEVRAMASPDEFEEGLVEILDKVVRAVASARGRGLRVCVNATPGFKAETTFFVIASLLAGADAVLYIHDSFREPVILPTIPIAPRTEEVEKLMKVFGGGDVAPLHALYQEGLSEEELRRYRDMGLIEVREGAARIRTWVRKMLELLAEARG